MKAKIWKFIGFSLIVVMFLGIVAYAYPVKAINVNVNQHTFVLSNEAPGYAISLLVNAGYANYSLYDTLLAIRADADPSVSSILTDAFLSTVGNAPASAQVFTTKLKDVNSQGATIGISTDGTFLTNGVIVGLAVNYTTLTSGDIFGSTYQGKQGITSLDTVVSGAGSFRLVYNSSGPLTSWTVNGPLAGMTTTYNVFGILYEPSSSASQSPSPTSTSTPTAASNPTQTPGPTQTPAPSSFPVEYIYAIVAVIVIIVTAISAYTYTKRKKKNIR
jgi:hypothetical protein